MDIEIKEMTGYSYNFTLIVCAKMKCFTVKSFLFLLFLSSTAANEEEIIKSVNQKQSTWIAGRNFPSYVKLEDLRRRNGEIELPTPRLKLKVHTIPEQEIPESFDARTKWPFCSDVINTIRNQGNCGSCWAFASTTTMSDRLCIESKGAIKFQFSPQDLLECCSECGYGCGGGNKFRAWNYWTKYGIVSGGDFLSHEGCKPYSADSFLDNITPECKAECANKNFTVSYVSDKRFGVTSYQVAADVRQMQYEIMTNGPIHVSYMVYDDFYGYKSGVYQHVAGDSAGRHSVKIIGWGTENGVPYWLVANSWGEEWGNLKGFFKILRGENHCGIENAAAAGKPLL